MTRRRITDDVLRVAIDGLRRGLSDDEAGTLAGVTGRAIRYRLAALGLTASEVRPKPPAPEALDPYERRRRLAQLAAERKWERGHAAGTRAWSHQASVRRRDLHIMLTADAFAAVHDEADRRGCSMSSLVADTLYEAGIIPEA